MDRPIKLWEFISGILVMAIAFGTIIYNCGIVNGKTDVRLNAVEQKAAATETKLQELNVSMGNKMDKIGDNITDIKILLQTKQDRKN